MKIVYPDEIALQFLTRYKQYEQGEQYEYMFTPEQNAAMMATILKDPDEMISFFNSVQTQIIGHIAMERGEDNYFEIAKALSQWNNVLASQFVPIMHMLSKSPEERKEMLEQHEKLETLKKAEQFSQPSLDEFNLGDIEGLLRKDEDDPPVH